MPTNFFELAGELRNVIYELVLVCQDPVSPRSSLSERATTNLDADRQVGYHTSLLRVSKTTHHEAGPIFYGQNCFGLSHLSEEDISKFLCGIGRSNALNIRNVRIDFQSLYCPRHGFTMVVRDLGINLRTITMTAWSMHEVVFSWQPWSCPLVEASHTIKDVARFVSPFTKIILELSEALEYDDNGVGETLSSFGWEIRQSGDFYSHVSSDVRTDTDDNAALEDVVSGLFTGYITPANDGFMSSEDGEWSEENEDRDDDVDNESREENEEGERSDDDGDTEDDRNGDKGE